MLDQERRRMHLLLASKGVPPSYWADRDVNERKAYFFELVEMLKPSEE